MSDKPISVGDLVVIVGARPCCAQHSGFGIVYRVERIETDHYRCHYCKKAFPGATTIAWGSGLTGAEIHRVRRIPPLDELEGKREQADLGEAMRKLRKELERA